MPPFLAEFLSQLKAIWARLDGGQRMTIATVTVATVVGIGAIVWYSGQPDYQTVRTAASQGEQADISEALTAAGIRSRNEGLSVQVDYGDLGSAQQALRAAGLLVKSDRSNKNMLEGLMTTAKGREQELWNMMLREAEFVLSDMPSVLKAKVNGHRVKTPVFATSDPNEKSSAVATVTLVPDADFRPVARSAVEILSAALGVRKDSVTVINAANPAQRYSIDAETGADTDASDFYKMQALVEDRLSRKALLMLAPAFENKVRVTVNLEFDTTGTRSNMINPPPEGLQPVMTKTVTRDKTGPAKVANGDPNLAVSANSGAASGPQTTKGEVDKEKETVKEYDEKTFGGVWTWQNAPDIEKIGVSIVIAEQALDDYTDETEKTRVAKEIEDLVKKAVGWTQGRDEPVAISRLKFPADQPVAEESGPDIVAMATEYGPMAGQILAVLLVIFFLKSMLKKAELKVAPKERDEAEALMEEQEESRPEEIARRMRREIEKAISEDPASVSRLLENWLTEQKV